MNLEGYANLDHWVAELDRRIEGILQARLAQIIEVWCTEFDRVDDGDTRRDILPSRDLLSKRRADKRVKDEKVIHSALFLVHCVSLISADIGRQYDAETDRSRDSDTEPGYFP